MSSFISLKLHSPFCAGLVLYVAYAILQCSILHPESTYSVYDSDNFAKARWFLLKRLKLAQGQSRTFSPGSDYSIFNSTMIANQPGGPNKWRLGQDPSGELVLLDTQPLFLCHILRSVARTTSLLFSLP